jgi:capsular exopolysaccharide synthesis family protein
MNKSDIEPAGRAPIWPLSVRPDGGAIMSADWGQQSYGASRPLDLNLQTIWRIVSEWRWLILACAAAGIAAAVIVTLLTTPLYRAVAVLEISPPSVEVMENSKAKSGGDDKAFLATQFGLLQSRSLAERVTQDLNLASKPEMVPQTVDRTTRQKIATGILMGNFDVDPVPNSRLVRISYSSPSPQLAQQITNSFADNFINTNLERRYEASSYARTFLERQIARIKGELEKSERALVAYAQRQNIINTAGNLPGQSSDVNSLDGSSLVALNASLSAAQTKRIAAEQKYREASGATAGDVMVGTSALRNEKSTLEAAYEEKLTQFKPDYPEMIRLRTRIEALERAIKSEGRVVAGGRTTTLLADYRAAVAEERSLRARVAQLQGLVLKDRGARIQYNILQREADTNRALYDALLQRYKEIGVAGGIGTNLVSVVDRAEPPGGAYSPNLMLNLLIGLALGLAAGLGAALALEFINDTIKTPDDVRDKLQLASLGIIPKKKGNDALAEELKDQSSPISEAYYSLRTSLQFSTDAGAPKSLLITSTRASEGKSSTTLALAQNFARLGNRVLLIDADLRKPAFVTGVEQTEGLSKLLTNAEPTDKSVLNTQFENLFLLPCGPLPPNPAELLASPRLRAILAEAIEQYDMVIVDGPPVLGLADAPLLSAACRGTLLVVESGKTRTKAAVDAINRLRAAGGHIVGAVLTKFRYQAHGYGYGYSYEPYRYGGISSREREIRLIAAT